MRSVLICLIFLSFLAACTTVGEDQTLTLLIEPTDDSVTPSPDYIGASRLYAEAEEQYSQGATDQALDLLKQASELNPSDEEIWIFMVEILNDQGNYQDAVQAAQQAQTLNPDNSKLWSLLGYARYQESECSQAISDLDKAIELDENNVLAYLVKGLCLYEENDFEAAIENYTQAITLDPSRDDAYFDRGNAYDALNMCEEAIPDYQTALDLAPDDPDYLNNLANCYQTIGDYQSAVETIDLAIAIQPTAKFLTNKAEYLRNLGQYDKALEVVDEALEQDNSYALAYRAKGNVFFDQGQFEEAIIAYRQGLEIDSGDVSIRYNLGVAYDELEMYEEAAQQWDEIAQQAMVDDNLYRHGEYFGALNNVAYLYADKLETNLELALEYINYVLPYVNDVQLAYYLDTQAWVLFKLNDCDQSLEVISEAISLSPENEDIKEHFSTISSACSQF